MADAKKKLPKGLRQVIYLPPKLHKMLRLAAARNNRTRSDIAAEAVTKYFQMDLDFREVGENGN